jgi:alkylation response protein AidB-like acyl-CoA dehydrogenase
VSHFKSNVRDHLFNLFEVFVLDRFFGQGVYSDLDVDTATEMLGEMVRLAEGPIADSFVEGDRNPPVFDPATHTVTLPEAFKKSVRATLEGGWDKVGVVDELGGMPMPKALMWALHEHILGANPAVWMYAGGTGFANIFYHVATEEQKKWAVIAAERGWGSTMCLAMSLSRSLPLR